MTSPHRVVPVDLLREAARQRVEETSLRSVAAETRMSYTALRHFLRGSEPYSDNLRRLTEWYLSTAQVAIPVEASELAMRLLIGRLPEPEQSKAREEVVEVVRRYFKQVGLDAPHLL